ncbi:MAG: hypothetical protein F4129_12135 [Acidimicrobiia bacterium]|nr:hypothetical protein [Acidimicrobiia bacterium]MYL10485.1 hypothetical protein [Acidimicrobiia bacterium]
MPDQAQANYEVYVARHQEEMEREHRGKIVLMHEGEIVGIYNDDGDAYEIGCDKYGLGNFSAILIGANPIDLGTLALSFD